MITCPNCKCEIDEDSYYCDQCGSELYYCIKCRRLSRGRNCTVCGAVLVKASDRASMIAVRPSQRFKAAKDADRVHPLAPDALDQQMAAQPDPVIVQQELSNTEPSSLVRIDDEAVAIKMQSGAVIGRINGEYVDVFGSMGYVSGTHAQLDYDDHSHVWTITDLKSTNGTRINKKKLSPGVPTVMQLGDIVTIAFTDFVVR